MTRRLLFPVAATLALGLAVLIPSAPRLLARVAAPAAGLVIGPVDVTVSSVDELKTALARASGGTIRLVPGRYPPIAIRGARPAHTVTIVSADPARPAQMTGVTVRDSANLAFEGLSFGVLDPAAQYGLSILASERIAARRLAFAWPGGVQGRAVISAIIVRASKQVEITDSTFRDHWHGVSFLNVEDFRVADNLFTDLRTDGIRGGGVRRVTIERNVIGNFHPAPGDHPDGIQLWSTQQTEAGREVTIRDNLVWRGAGGITQGVFIRDTFERLPFQEITVSGNLLVGTMYNGIALLGVDSGAVSGNTVIAFPDMKSWISLRQSPTVTLRDNAAMLFTVDNKVIAPPSSNRLTAPARDRGLSAIATWLARHPALRPRFEALRATQGSTPATAG